MAEDDPEGHVVIRVKDRAIHPSPDDTEQIWEAVVAVAEVFESLIQVVADERTAAGLRAGGNGEVQRPTPGDLQEVAQELSDALTAFSGNELNVDALEGIAADLDQRATAARDLFEAVSSSASHDHVHASPAPTAPIGVIANPMSGRDVRRLAARARRETPEDKRNQIERAVIGAAATGANRFLLMRDCFRISQGAVELMDVGAEFEFVGGAIDTKPSDTAAAARAMRAAGCAAVIVLGGDGTNRIISKAWPDAPIIPMSTGTNNVFLAHLTQSAVAASRFVT